MPVMVPITMPAIAPGSRPVKLSFLFWDWDEEEPVAEEAGVCVLDNVDDPADELSDNMLTLAGSMICSVTCSVVLATPGIVVTTTLATEVTVTCGTDAFWFAQNRS